MIDKGKRSKTLNEVKPVEKINKNLQSFLEISHVKRKSFFHTNYETMHMSTRILLDSGRITSYREIARMN